MIFINFLCLSQCTYNYKKNPFLSKISAFFRRICRGTHILKHSVNPSRRNWKIQIWNSCWTSFENTVDIYAIVSLMESLLGTIMIIFKPLWQILKWNPNNWAPYTAWHLLFTWLIQMLTSVRKKFSNSTHFNSNPFNWTIIWNSLSQLILRISSFTDLYFLIKIHYLIL